MSGEVVVTFDLEDWFQLIGRRFGISAGRVTRGRLRAQVATILELLARRDARATFFVLGMTAEACPEVVADVRDAGHEIARHGYGHELVRTLTPQAFREDLTRALAVLEALGAPRPVGYRAPEFSIDRASFWALDVLLDCGFTYDSSVYPFRGRRYGIAGFPTGPHAVTTPSGRSIDEIPLAVVELGGRHLPVAGGGYWRLLPRPVLDWAMDRIGGQRPPMLYFHPAEFDARALNPPLLSAAIARMTLQQSLGRRSVPDKLDAILRDRRGISAADYLARLAAGAASVAA